MEEIGFSPLTVLIVMGCFVLLVAGFFSYVGNSTE
jgi:hypothetical protein